MKKFPWKSNLQIKVVKPNNPFLKNHFEQMQDALRKLIEVATENYYSKLSRKFAAKKTNPKC